MAFASVGACGRTVRMVTRTRRGGDGRTGERADGRTSRQGVVSEGYLKHGVARVGEREGGVEGVGVVGETARDGAAGARRRNVGVGEGASSSSHRIEEASRSEVCGVREDVERAST